MKKYLLTFCTAAASLFCGTAFSQPISTIAGTGIAGYTGDGGAAVAARINHPAQIAADAVGNVYVAEQYNHCIRKISAGGIISTVAGIGIAGFSGDGGPATAATLNNPYGITVDASGNLYIGDAFNHRVRKVSITGIITTVAGTGTGGFSGDGGPATAAMLWNPMFLHVDHAGDIYVCDNQNNRVRKVTAAGVISTVAGNGLIGYTGDGSAATAARVQFPNGVWADNVGNVFIAQPVDNVIRKVNASGIISTIAGTGIGGFSGDGGPATAARLAWPHQLYLDASGKLYIGDAQNNRIRVISPSGVISTVAGIGTPGFSGDGGPATAAQLNNSCGVCLDNSGRICIVDQNNQRIRRVGPNNYIPVFTAGAKDSIEVCSNEMPISMDSILAVSDLDTAQTLAWSPVAGPAHGILVATYSAPSTGAIVVPSGLSYTPSAGYAGNDSFKVKVFDGIAYDTITIYVVVVSMPNAGVISGIDSVCPGQTITLSETVVGGIWSTTVAGITTISSAGVVSGLTTGFDTVTYTVTNLCGTATAQYVIKVLSVNYCHSLAIERVAGNREDCTIYPNPSGGKFSLLVSSPVSKDITLTITDVAGKRLKEFTVSTNVPAEFSTDMLPGIYFLNVMSDQGMISKKIILTPQVP
jgi:hypothetical protein